MQKKVAMAHVVGMGLCKMARACRVFGLERSSAYYRAQVLPEKLMQEGWVAEVSREHPALGYRKVAALVRAVPGEAINVKRVARLRRREGLRASRRPGKRRRLRPGQSERRRATRADEVWSYDCIEDATVTGRKLRTLSVIDEYTRECLRLRPALSFPSRRVIDCLQEIMVCTGRKPAYLRSDNGPEFVAHRVQEWLEEAPIGPCYIEPGAPWENGHVESFHASVRAELLDRELIFSVDEAAAMLEDRRHHFNFERPHGSLGYLAPAVAAKRELPLRATPCAPVSRWKSKPKQLETICRQTLIPSLQDIPTSKFWEKRLLDRGARVDQLRRGLWRSPPRSAAGRAAERRAGSRWIRRGR